MVAIHPLSEPPAATIEPRVTNERHQVAQVRDVRILECDHRVSASVCRAVVFEADGLFPDPLGPRRGECRFGKHQRCVGLRGRGLHLEQLWHFGVGDVLDCQLAEDRVTRRVVAVVMRVDQQIDLAGRQLLQALQRNWRGIRKLRVDDNHAVGGHEHADGSAAATEHIRRRLEGRRTSFAAV